MKKFTMSILVLALLAGCGLREREIDIRPVVCIKWAGGVTTSLFKSRLVMRNKAYQVEYCEYTRPAYKMEEGKIIQLDYVDGRKVIGWLVSSEAGGS